MNYRNPFTGRPFQPRFDVPEIFGEALSYEDQIIWLAKHFKKLKDFVDGLGLDTIKEDVLEAVTLRVEQMLEPFMADISYRISKMEEKVDHVAASDLIYDPTQGGYVPSKEAMRRVYAALVQTGTSHVHDMSQLTVDAMSGKGTHAYSVTGLAEVDWSDEIGTSHADIPVAPGESTGDEALRMAQNIEDRLEKTNTVFDVDLLGDAVLTRGGYVAAPDEEI